MFYPLTLGKIFKSFVPSFFSHIRKMILFMHPVFVVFNNLVHENYLNLSKAIKDYQPLFILLYYVINSKKTELNIIVTGLCSP